MSKAPLSPAQWRALESAVVYGDPTHHLDSELARGGWGVTREALQRRGLLDTACRITEAGRAVHAARQPRMA
jgi:hypothetical protein